MNIEVLPVPELSREELKAMPYADFLETPYWKEIAARVKERDGMRCVVCNSRKSLAAHHRTYEHHGEEHLFLGDLTTLCERCHTRHHFPAPQKEARRKQKLAPIVQFETKRAKREKRFWRRASVKLGINMESLMALGRARVRELLNKGKEARNLARAEVSPPQSRIVGNPDTVIDDMPPGDPIIITEAILDKCRANGAFTTATILALGLNPKQLKRGWASAFVDRPMPREQLLRVMGGRHIYSKATMKFKRKKESQLKRLLDSAFPS